MTGASELRREFHKERAHALRLKALHLHSVARYTLMDEEKSHEERQAQSDWYTAQALELTELAEVEEAMSLRGAA